MTYIVIFCFVAVSLIQPNAAIGEIGAAIDSASGALINMGVSAVQNATAQIVSLFNSLPPVVAAQAGMNLANQVWELLTRAINAAVGATGGSAALIPSCLQKYQASVSAFEINSLQQITNNCVRNNLTEAYVIISNIAASSNNITAIILNVNSILATACPAAAAGDIVGFLYNGACSLATIADLTKQVTFQSLAITMNGVQGALLLASMGPLNVDLPCVAFQLGFIAFNVVGVIDPIVSCTRSWG